MILSTGERSSIFDCDGSRFFVGLWFWSRVGLKSESSVLTDGVTCAGIVGADGLRWVELGDGWMSPGRFTEEGDGLCRPSLKFEG